MPDVKISALPATATPLGGDELVPIVNDPAGFPATEQVSVTNLRGDTGNVLGGVAGDSLSVAVGAVATGGYTRDVVIGVNAEAPTAYPAGDNVAIGHLAKTPYLNGVAIGRSATTGAGGNHNTAIGRDAATSGGSRQVAIGYSAAGTNDDAVAVGANTSASDQATAVGANASSGSQGTAVGFGASVETGPTAIADAGLAVGRDSTTTHQRSVALGVGSTTTAVDQVMIGPRDLEIEGIVKGIVLVDRTLSTRHRVYLDNGALTIEAA